MAKAILVVGRTKSGKTTAVKKILSALNMRKEIYDVQREYNTGKPLPDMEDFLNLAAGLTETCIVFEEATIFFSNRGDEKVLKRILVSKRHTRNIIILCFHSLRSVPTYIFDLTDFYVLHKTNDNVRLIEKKFEGMQVVEDFYTVMDSENPYFEVVRALN